MFVLVKYQNVLPYQDILALRWDKRFYRIWHIFCSSLNRCLKLVNHTTTKVQHKPTISVMDTALKRTYAFMMTGTTGFFIARFYKHVVYKTVQTLQMVWENKHKKKQKQRKLIKTRWK